MAKYNSVLKYVEWTYKLSSNNGLNGAYNWMQNSFELLLLKLINIYHQHNDAYDFIRIFRIFQ